MARIPTLNVNGIVTRRNATPALVPLVDPAGVLLSADHPRAPRIADASATLCEALMRGGCSFSAKGHGLRWFNVSGLSPLFTERNGLADGTAYLYGGVAKREAILAALPPGAVVATRAEAKANAGLYVQLNPAITADDADRVVSVCFATCSMQGRGDGWTDMVGFGATIPVPEANPASVSNPPPAPKRKGKGQQPAA